MTRAARELTTGEIDSSLQAMAQTAPSSGGFKLAWHFVDVPYNRTSFTFAGYRADAVRFLATFLVGASTPICSAHALALVEVVASCS